MKTPPIRRRLWLGLAFVLIVAAGFRLWRLHSIPPGLFGDEAADALDALDVLAGRGQVFFPSNFGREGLHMWILAGAFKLMGLTPYAIRLPSALAGIIAAGAAYWLGYELFVARTSRDGDGQGLRNAWLTALAAGLFTATSYWHVHFSRFGIRGVFTTMMAALTMAALWRAINAIERAGAAARGGLDRRGALWWAVAGLFMGLGAHFYTASRFIPLFVGLFLAGWLILTWLHVLLRPPVVHVRGVILGALLLFGVSAVVFAPLGHYFLTHPGSFTQRAGEVSALQDGFSLSTLQVIGKAAALNLLQFIWPGHGDMARFYNLPGRAVFTPPIAALALLGLGVSVKRWRNPVYSFLLLWLLIMASPSFLAVDRAPTLPRVLGVIPGVFFFPAIGLVAGLDWLTARLAALSVRARHGITWGLAALLLLLPGVITFRDYFLVWGPAPETADAFEVDMTTAWRWLEAHPPAGPLYISADIYKHPSFSVLYEQVPTTEYFTRIDPQLHWFDARRAWPLPHPDSHPTILVGNSALPPAFIQNLLHIELTPIGDGAAYRATSNFYVEGESVIWFSEQLGLISQFILPPEEGKGEVVMVQVWRTRGPIIDDIAPYQIQSALLGPDGSQIVQVSDEMGVRPPEWEQGGAFVTWQVAPWPGEDKASGAALRVVPSHQPPLQPAGAEAGWVQLPLKRTPPTGP
ncbi:MAG TPA: hypothetical protein EYP25_05920 [Anaerolineae bacterium]|nr:hypothetical protein [Anaerolineae bacterium]